VCILGVVCVDTEGQAAGEKWRRRGILDNKFVLICMLKGLKRDRAEWFPLQISRASVNLQVAAHTNLCQTQKRKLNSFSQSLINISQHQILKLCRGKLKMSGRKKS
jgi:ribosomal protein L14E/L6E/L27E